MNSTSHADNMIPLVGTQAKRKNTSSIEFDWEKEVRSLMLDFRVPLVVRNTFAMRSKGKRKSQTAAACSTKEQDVEHWNMYLHKQIYIEKSKTTK